MRISEDTIRQLVRDEIENFISEGPLVNKAKKELHSAKEDRENADNRLSRLKMSNSKKSTQLKQRLSVIDAEMKVNDSAKKLAQASDKELEYEKRMVRNDLSNTNAGEEGDIRDRFDGEHQDGNQTQK